MKRNSDTRLLVTGFLLIHAGIFVLIILLKTAHTIMTRNFELDTPVVIGVFSALILLSFLYTARIFGWYKLWAVPKASNALLFYYRCKRLGLVLDTSDDRIALVNSLSFIPKKRFELLDEYLEDARNHFLSSINDSTFFFDKDKWRISLYVLLQSAGIACGIYLIVSGEGKNTWILGFFWALFVSWYLFRNIRLLSIPNPVFTLSPKGIWIYNKGNINWQHIRSIHIDKSDFSRDNKIWVTMSYAHDDKEGSWKMNIAGFTRNPFEIIDIFIHFAPGITEVIA